MDSILGGTNEHRPTVGPPSKVQESAQGTKRTRRRGRFLDLDIPPTKDSKDPPRLKSREAKLEELDQDNIIDAMDDRNRETQDK